MTQTLKHFGRSLMCLPLSLCLPISLWHTHYSVRDTSAAKRNLRSNIFSSSSSTLSPERTDTYQSHPRPIPACLSFPSFQMAVISPSPPSGIRKHTGDVLNIQKHWQKKKLSMRPWKKDFNEIALSKKFLCLLCPYVEQI